MNVPPDEQERNMTGEGQQPQVEGEDVPTPAEGEEPVPGQPGIEEAGERVETPAEPAIESTEEGAADA